MTTKREAVLVALHQLLTNRFADVGRNDPKAGELNYGAYMVLHDGEPGEAEITLSPMTWHYRHAAQLDLFAVNGPDGEDREVIFDQVCEEIGIAVAEDRTLGGLCDWVEAQAPLVQSIDQEGSQAAKVASIAILLHYSTTNPLG